MLKPGDIVWARMPGYPHWPAQLVAHDDPYLPKEVVEGKPENPKYLAQFFTGIATQRDYYWFSSQRDIVPYMESADKHEASKDVWRDPQLLASINEARNLLNLSPLTEPPKKTKKPKPKKTEPKPKKTEPKKKTEKTTKTTQKRTEPASKKEPAKPQKRLQKKTQKVEKAQKVEQPKTEQLSKKRKQPDLTTPQPSKKRKLEKPVTPVALAQPSPPINTIQPAIRPSKISISDSHLAELHQDLRTAIQDDNTTTIISILKDLNEKYFISPQQIVNEPIGKTINQDLKKYSDPSLKALRSELLKRLKNMVKSMDKQNSSTKQQLPAPAKKPQPKASNSTVTEKPAPKQTTSTDNLDDEISEKITKFPSVSDNRQYWRKKLSKAIADPDDTSVSLDDAVNLGCQIEEVVHLHYKNDEEKYFSQLKAIRFNLADRNNDFRIRVVGGEIPLNNLPTIKSHQMASKEKLKQRSDFKKEEKRMATTAKVSFTEGSEFSCRRCGSRRVHYYQLQTRSADEPMTTFLTCENGHRWKM